MAFRLEFDQPELVQSLAERGQILLDSIEGLLVVPSEHARNLRKRFARAHHLKKASSDRVDAVVTARLDVEHDGFLGHVPENHVDRDSNVETAELPPLLRRSDHHQILEFNQWAEAS